MDNNSAATRNNAQTNAATKSNGRRSGRHSIDNHGSGHIINIMYLIISGGYRERRW